MAEITPYVTTTQGQNELNSPRHNHAVIADSKNDASKSLINSAITEAMGLKVCIQWDKRHAVFAPHVYPKDIAKTELWWTKCTKNVEPANNAILLTKEVSSVTAYNQA